jgi:hypothetical protein
LPANSLDGSVWRLGTSQALSVLSAAGATVSSAAFGAQTYAVGLSFPALVSSTAGCRIKVINGTDSAVSSTTGTLLPSNWVQYLKVNPGQQISAISNDAGTFSLGVTELTK